MEKKPRKSIYKCPYCNFTTPEYGSIGGHISGHTKRGEVLSKKNRREISLPFRTSFPVLVPKTEMHAESGRLAQAGPLDPSIVAAELLKKVVDKINQETNYNNQIHSLKEQVFDLECRLKKAVEEKERAIKANNEIVKQHADGKYPTIDSVLAALRRDPDIIRGH